MSVLERIAEEIARRRGADIRLDVGAVGGFSPVIDEIVIPDVDADFVDQADIAAYELERLYQTPKLRTIGVKDPRMVVAAKNASGVAVTLTQTTFDTISRPGFAEILLTNDTGADADLIGLSIVGKRIIQVGGKNGFVHDYFIDEQSIARDGERKLEIANGFIASKGLVEALADYWWKNAKTQKHIYSVSITGTRFDLTPGERYTLTVQVEKNGIYENVSSVVELYSSDIEKQSGQPGITHLVFREIEETWAKTAIAQARFAAGGNAQRKLSRVTTLTVGASTFTDETNFVCDGTADDAQIQKAIDIISGKGGGTVVLSPGTFVLASTLTINAGVDLIGSGVGNTTVQAASGVEIIVRSASAIKNMKVERTAGSDILLRNGNGDDDCSFENLSIDPGGGSRGIRLITGSRAVIANVRFESANFITGGIENFGNTHCIISNVQIDGGGGSTSANAGLYVNGDDSVISNVTISNWTSDESTQGMRVDSDRVSVSNILISDISQTAGGGRIAYGLYVRGKSSQYSNINIIDIDNTSSAALSRGLLVDDDGNNFSGLTVTGCSGTGIEIAATADRTSFSNGRTHSNTTADYSDSGTNTKRDGTTFETT